MPKKSLQLQQLDEKLHPFKGLEKIVIPPTGWLKAIRLAIGMSAQQLGDRLSITKQGVGDLEKREAEGNITLKALRETAEALDMQLVYGFVPKDGSLEKMIEQKARKLAKQVVTRTSKSMELEDQENSYKRIEKAIEERTQSILNEMPKALWD